MAAALIVAATTFPLFAPALVRAQPVDGLPAILGRSGLERQTSFAVADAATGALIEAHRPDVDRPPASVAKIATALFALAALGPDHRFRTAVTGSGAVIGGRLDGDLVLVGGGDPVLDTDALGDMVGQLAAGGVMRVGGRLTVDDRALPSVAVTEPDQPAHVGYNPAISGLNLNFNRVHLAWEPAAGGPALAVTAPGARHSVRVRAVRVEVGAVGSGMSHHLEPEAEVWRIAPRLVTGRGSLWLPSRRPAGYASDVFAALSEQAGMAAVPAPTAPSAAAPPARVLATHESPDLLNLVRGMLLHSTNLTAEAVGLAAAQAAGRPATTLAGSAGAMGDWTRARYGLTRAAFANHSGLTVRSRLTARETVRLLAGAERDGLGALLPERSILDAKGDALRGRHAAVRAKTGTMHFLRGLAGYYPGPGRRLAFVIYAAEPERRTGLGPQSLEPPPGARDWLVRARTQENALLRRWAALYGA